MASPELSMKAYEVGALLRTGGHPEIDRLATAMRVCQYGANKLEPSHQHGVQEVVGSGIRDFVNSICNRSTDCCAIDACIYITCIDIVLSACQLGQP